MNNAGETGGKAGKMEKIDVMRLADGETVDVPAGERAEFEKAAKERGLGFEPVGVVRFADGETAEVPESERAEFETEARARGMAWEPVRTVSVGGETAEVPESETGEFYEAYRSDPRFAEERRTDALKAAERLGVDTRAPGVAERAAGALGAGVEGGRLVSLEEASAGAANMFRGLASAPATLAEKGLDLAGFAARGVEALYGEDGKSGFREAVERAGAWMRERSEGGALGMRDEQGRESGDGEWGVTLGGTLANTVAEVYLSAGAVRAAGALRGAPAAERTALAALRPGALSILYGGSRAEESARKAERAGRGKGAQVGLGAATGAWETAVESVSQVFGLQAGAREALANTVARSMRKMALNVLGEGAEEAAQEAGGGAADKLARVDERTWGEIGRDAAVSAALGLLAAGASEGGGALNMLSGRAREARELRREGDEILKGSVLGEKDEGGRLKDEGESGTGTGTTGTGTGEGGAYGQGETGAERQAGADGSADGAAAGEEAGGVGAEGAPQGQDAAGDVAGLGRALTRADGSRVESLLARPKEGGGETPGVRLLMPDGKFAWSADPELLALAEYWMRDRATLPMPPAPRGDRGRQPGDPQVNASRRAGFDVGPGKSVLVTVGRSPKGYPARVVEVLDDTHVRVRIDKTTRSAKNNRAGYADVDVRQLREWRAAQVKREHEEQMRRLGLNAAERARVRADAAEFRRLVESADELLDTRALEAASYETGRKATMAQDEEMRRAYARAAAMLETEEDLTTPLGRARALPLLREMLGKMREGRRGEKDEGGRLKDEGDGDSSLQPSDFSLSRDTPEEIWLERFRLDAEAEREALEETPFELEGMTPQEMEADRARVEAARARREQRAELERRAAAPISGTAGDMTGTLPGMEGTSDVPLFTEQDELYNTAAAGRGMVGGAAAGTYGQESGGADAGARERTTRGPAAGPVAETGPQERPGVGMDLRDAVQLYRALTGMLPKIKERLRNKDALGLFRPGTREIELLAGMFGLYDENDRARLRGALEERGYEGAELEAQLDREINALVERRRREPQKRPVKVMVHELAHLVDYLPEGMIQGRGNILGHIAALKGMLKGAIGPEPGAPGTLTEAEKRELRRRAEAQMRAELGEARTVIEEIVREVPEYRVTGVTAEDVKALLGTAAGQATPELYAWFAAQDSITKREILIRALKGVVDERAAAAGGRREQTGVRRVTERVERSVPGYTAEDGRRRFRELLRQETEARRLIERKAVTAEAERIIPWWRGVEGPMEEYFRRPEEMYAELFGIFLADPSALEERAPVTFRAFAGWMNARPEVKREYADWLAARESGQAQREHVRRLKEGWNAAAEDDLRKMLEDDRKPSRRQEWMGFRYHFDRRLGPYYMVARASFKRLLAASGTELERGAARARYTGMKARAKEYLHRASLVRYMLTDIHGRAAQTLRRAGLAWTDMGEYAFHNRVAYELDGRAAAHGWEPVTSLKRLEEMRAELGEGRWTELGKAWVEFREAYEQHVIKNENVRRMLGPEMMATLEKNIHYVTFQHVPTPEEIRSRKAKLAADKAKGGLGSEDALDVMGEELEGRFGRAVGSGIYRLTGSFRPVADPVSATVQKAASLLEAAYRNELKRELFRFAREAGFEGVREAEEAYDPFSKRRMPKLVDNQKWKTVYYLDGGTLKGYVADKWLAESFENADGQKLQYLSFTMKLNSTISAFFTTLNYAFYERAYIKDKQAAAANVPGMRRAPAVAFLPGGELFGMLTRYIPERYARALPKFLWGPQHLEYWEAGARRAALLIRQGDFESALREADRLDAAGRHREADQKRSDVQLARAGLSEGVLMNQSEVVRAGSGLGTFDRTMRKYGLRTGDTEQARGAAATVADWITGLGEIREDTTKLATLAFLMDKGVTREERKLIVTEWGGSPDFSERGAASGYMELVLGPFINARKEGFVRNVKAAADHPAEWAAKKMAYTVAPAAVRWMLFTGAGMALWRALDPDDEEREKNPLWHFMKWAYRKGVNCSDYLNKNYNTIPLPVDTGNPECSLVLTIPMDESEQVASTLTWNALDQLAGRFGVDTGTSAEPLAQSLLAIAGQTVPALEIQSPVAGTLMMIGEFLFGKNHYDSFRDRDVFTDNELAARFSNPAGALRLAGEVWNRTGGGMFWSYNKDNVFAFEQPRMGELLNKPVIQPTLGKFVRVVHSGKAQAVARIQKVEQAVKADAQLDAQEMFARYVKEGYNMSDDIVRQMGSNVYFSDEWQRLNQRYVRERDANPLIDGWRKSKDPAVMRRFENLMRRIQQAEG